MKELKYMAGVVLTAIAISCDEDTVTIGESLNKDGADKMTLTSSSFEATSQTILADSVLTNPNDWYFGRIQDPQTQTIVTSEFTTQFNILENIQISTENYFVSKDNGRAAADSCDIVIYTKSPFSSLDLLAAMQMRVRELDTFIDPSKRYYSNFNPESYLRKDENAIDLYHTFTYTNLTDSETDRAKTTYLNNIHLALNDPYTAKDGVTYKNYGTYILRQLMQYKEKNNRYPNSYVFARDICPGFAFEIVDGQGFHAAITDVGLRIYYTVNRDSTYKASVVLAGTKEVVQTMKITNDKTAMKQLAEETGHTYLKTPAGLFTQVSLPISDIWNEHSTDSLLSTKIVFQRLNNETANERSLGVPQMVMMVMKDSLNTFFEKKMLPDSKTSYHTNLTASNNTYTFSNISNLVTYMKNQHEMGIAKLMKQNASWSKEQAVAEWEKAHPDWNKVILVPIAVQTSSSTSTVSRIGHCMSLTSTRLIGGKDTKIAVNVVYGKFAK